MNKKILSAILCLCLIMSVVCFVASCTGNEQPTEAPTTQTPEPTDTPTSTPTSTPTEDVPTETPEPKVSHTISVIDMTDNTGIADVTVEIWNQAETKMVASAKTNTDGIAEFKIDYKTYIIKLTDVPENYNNVDTYLLNKSEKTYTIHMLANEDMIMDGSDEAHRLPVYDGDSITVAAGATLFCTAPRTPGYTMTISNAEGLKVVYKDIEYTAEEGTITVQFDEQAYDETNSIPNNFSVINTTEAEISVVVRAEALDAGTTKDNPIVLDIGTATTHAFTDTVNAYYYEFSARIAGTFVISSTDAKISIYAHNSDTPTTDTRIDMVAGETIVIMIENASGTLDAVTFVADFE